MKVRNKFFGIKSIPNVMFLEGTSYKECKKIDYNLTKKEYDQAISDYNNANKKAEKKTLNKELSDKPDKKVNADKK